MNQKPLFLAVAIIVLIVIGGAFWCKEKRSQLRTESKVVGEQQFSSTTDQDTSRWQTKTTEFFSVKFPSKWHWQEGENSGYRSEIITNNASLDITAQYPDIVFYDKGIPERDDQELVISFYVRPTQEIDNLKLTTETIVENMFRETEGMMQGERYKATCDRINGEMTAILKCSRSDGGQTVQNYYIADRKLTVFMTVRKNSISSEEDAVIDGIAKALLVERR